MAIVRASPSQLFLKLPWGQGVDSQLRFSFQAEKIVCCNGRNMAKNEDGWLVVFKLFVLANYQKQRRRCVLGRCPSEKRVLGRNERPLQSEKKNQQFRLWGHGSRRRRSSSWRSRKPQFPRIFSSLRYLRYL
jgi:hypothetical protein